jgi:hypothetical protein
MIKVATIRSHGHSVILADNAECVNALERPFAINLMAHRLFYMAC